jgi:broad specificity phosphatase PhoE
MTSLEPKAIETGQIVASTLHLPLVTAVNLHEHERDSVSFCTNETQFRARVIRLLEHPEDHVFGEETGSQARQRFSRAITSAVERHPDQNLAVVTHGTVLSMFVSRVAGIESVPLWKRLGMPSFIALHLPDYSLLEIVANVAQLH